MSGNPRIEGAVILASDLEQRGHNVELLAVPPALKESVGDSAITVKVRVETQRPLRQSYNLLAWSVYEQGRKCLRQSVTDPAQLARYETYLDPLGPANRGVRAMTAYASLLPFIYLGQRHQFPNPPTHSDDQLDELWHVAMQSEDVAAQIAAQPGEIAGPVSIGLNFLRTKDPSLIQKLLTGHDKHYQLTSNDEGALRVEAPELERSIADWRSFADFYSKTPVRGKGCAAVRAFMDEAHERTAFSTYWRTIIDAATIDSRFFEADLESATDFLQRCATEPLAHWQPTTTPV